MRYITTALLLLLIGCTRTTTTWELASDQDPRVVLHQAEQDSRAGRHEAALAKFVWFHENALRLNPALSGVRRSFALSDWYELGEKYPPAMDAMRQAREQAAADVLSGKDARRSFADVAAIDRQLANDAGTRALFEVLDRDQPDVARKVFSLAERALLLQKRFELANKYVDPSADIKRFVESYREGLRMASDVVDPDYHRKFERKYFTHNASTLVALLVVNDRVEDARAVAAAAKQEIQDEEFEQQLASAMQGVIPKPWP